MKSLRLIFFLGMLAAWHAYGEEPAATGEPATTETEAEAEVDDGSGVGIVTEGDEEMPASQEPIVQKPVQRYTGPREKKAEGTQAKRQFNDEAAFVRSFYKFDGKPLVVDTE